MSKIKKITAILLIFVMIFTVGCTSGSRVKPMTEEELKTELQNSLDMLTIGIGYNWSDDVSSRLYNRNGSLFFRRILEDLHRTETGEDIKNEGPTAPAEIYISTAAKHFPLTEEEALDIFRKREVYVEETDSIYCSDGLGNVVVTELVDYSVEGDIITVNYQTILPENVYNRTGVLTVQLDPSDNSFKYLSNKVGPQKHTLYEDLSFLPREAREFFQENRNKALHFSMSKSTFLYGEYKEFDLQKIPQPVEVDGKNYLVTTAAYREVVEFMETIFAGDIQFDGSYIDVDGYGAFLDRDGPYNGNTNMSGYRVYDSNTESYIRFTQQVYTDPDTGLFTGIDYVMYNTAPYGWRFNSVGYIWE